MKETEKHTQVRETEARTPDEMKREFMKKFGKLAATAPLGMFLLMGPYQSAAAASSTFDEGTGGL